ncbi:MAG: hypothetical protein EOP55_22355 [Sphingobacteriales bacterium]|nr:MAG: hypothetical protein EOP55_22355 [Sphingobacteriales bacterium]
MSRFLKLVLFSFYLLLACNSDSHIINLLNSKKTSEVMLGCYKAGESRDKKYVQLLLKNANDPRVSTHINFKGISVYEAKMIALKKIYNKKPQKPITWNPDSTIIKFYTRLAIGS